MAKKYSSNAAFLAELSELIDRWCERRSLQLLGTVLPAYNSINGMTDGWGELLRALKALTLSQDELLPHEREIVSDLRRSVEEMLQAC
jgi:hypothetical protein